MDKSTDAKISIVTMPILLTVIAIDLIISIAWGFGVWNYSNNYKGNFLTILREIPGLLNNLATFSLAIFGITIVKKGIFDRGGTEYYKKKYGYKKLKNIVDKYNTYDNYEKVVDTITKLNTKRGNPPVSEYFRYVFKLQEIDDDFVKVWNDFNYYERIKDKNDSVRTYYKKLRKCVYIKVYEKYEND